MSLQFSTHLKDRKLCLNVMLAKGKSRSFEDVATLHHEKPVSILGEKLLWILLVHGK